MKKYNLILITTHQNNDNIFKLIDSVNNNIFEIKVLLIVISQAVKIEYQINNSSLSIINLYENKISLSKARNVALQYLIDNNITSEYIMFPDDDSSFDDVFFKNFMGLQSNDLSYITPIYNRGTKDVYLGKKPNGTQIKISGYNMVGSPNQIIKYEKYKEYVYFDEELGVGAKYGSSEDLDLFIRLNHAGAKFIYTDEIYSYHPKKTDIYKNKKLKDIVSRFKNYSSGFALLIFRYGLYNLIPTYLFRTFAAFLVFAMRLNFKLSLAYLIQFFIRIQLLSYFWLNKKKIKNEYSRN